MRVISFRSALQTAILAIACSTVGHTEDKSKADFSKPELEAKIAYCKTCHGLSGQGFRGALPMPRLAGQQPEYCENQLRAFIERRRTNPVMFNVARVLRPSMLTALAMHFKDLNPKPLGGAPRELVAQGKQIYENGVPSAEVPACVTCHGPEAKGSVGSPRLASQLHDYVFSTLVNWSKEHGQDKGDLDPPAIMGQIADKLTEAQVKAVAAYLSYLE
jgi:cytochrome c553